MDVVTRFAPSPTGHLHVGNLRTAILNWLFARANGGRFLLRLDDTDAARSEARFADAIRHDLDWLGMTPDGETRQSAHLDAYRTRARLLADKGRLYRCYETPEELELRRKILLGRGLPPIYDRAALSLTDADRERLGAEGRRPHWRFLLDHSAPIEWDDAIRGPQRFDPAALSDPVVRRADESWLYLFPSVVDDIDMGITHVVRGEDHVSNTAVQIQMFEALGAAPPVFAHAALLTGSEGKLSKRLGSLGIDHFREQGVEPAALIALLARIGTSAPVEPFADPMALAAAFDFSQFGRAPARFDEGELAALNARIVHQLDHAAVADRLPAGMGADAWTAVRPNLSRVSEAADWWQVIEGPIDPPEMPGEDRAYLQQAAHAADAIDWAADPWHALTGSLKESTGRKGKALFLPLRLALTGQPHGPDMAALLPLIGRDRARARLQSAGG